jgi:hypothetical protein
MRPEVLTVPFTVTHRDPSSLFAIEATVVAWREDRREAGEARAITLTLGAGTLHDADKGAFPVAGLELTIRVASGRIEPIGVLNPGVLSEFQQDGLLDAVSSALSAAGHLFPPTSQE